MPQLMGGSRAVPFNPFSYLPTEEQDVQAYRPGLESLLMPRESMEAVTRASETQPVAPASYLAGQVSGANVAGGVPGPRYGAIYYEPGLKGLAERALGRLPARAVDYMKRIPEPIYIRDIEPKQLSGKVSRSLGGYATSPTVSNRLSPGIPTSLGLERPSWLEAYSRTYDVPGQWKSAEDILSHELGHTAMAATGREGRGFPGVAANKELYDYLRAQGPKGTLAHKAYPRALMPEEIAAEFLSQGQVQGGTNVFDKEMVERALERFFPKQTGPSVFQELEGHGGYRPRGNMQTGGGTNPRSLPSFGIDVANLPQYAIDRSTEILSTITHQTTPSQKAEIINSVRRYLDRVRGLRKQGESSESALYTREQLMDAWDQGLLGNIAQKHGLTGRGTREELISKLLKLRRQGEK